MTADDVVVSSAPAVLGTALALEDGGYQPVSSARLDEIEEVLERAAVIVDGAVSRADCLDELELLVETRPVIATLDRHELGFVMRTVDSQVDGATAERLWMDAQVRGRQALGVLCRLLVPLGDAREFVIALCAGNYPASLDHARSLVGDSLEMDDAMMLPLAVWGLCQGRMSLSWADQPAASTVRDLVVRQSHELAWPSVERSKMAACHAWLRTTLNDLGDRSEDAEGELLLPVVLRLDELLTYSQEVVYRPPSETRATTVPLLNNLEWGVLHDSHSEFALEDLRLRRAYGLAAGSHWDAASHLLAELDRGVSKVAASDDVSVLRELLHLGSGTFLTESSVRGGYRVPSRRGRAGDLAVLQVLVRESMGLSEGRAQPRRHASGDALNEALWALVRDVECADAAELEAAGRYSELLMGDGTAFGALGKWLRLVQAERLFRRGRYPYARRIFGYVDDLFRKQGEIGQVHDWVVARRAALETIDREELV